MTNIMTGRQSSFRVNARSSESLKAFEIQLDCANVISVPPLSVYAAVFWPADVLVRERLKQRPLHRYEPSFFCAVVAGCFA